MLPCVQRVVPVGHTLVQRPPLQNSPAWHVVPQAPQFWLSERRSAHPVLQVDNGAAQVVVHWPASHRVPASQREPQAPQFSPSLAVETHVCMPAGPQATLPVGHRLEQLPPVQKVPSAHELPQAPQFRLSLRVSMHDVPHVTRGVGHDSRQVPSWQREPAAQAVPHAPQLAESL